MVKREKLAFVLSGWLFIKAIVSSLYGSNVRDEIGDVQELMLGLR